MVYTLRYGNTNTFFIGEGLLIDTDFAGTLSAFFRAAKSKDIKINDIQYVIATHYHPDHCGLISELMELGIKLVLLDNQIEYIHFADEIFSRMKGLHYKPIQDEKAHSITFEKSRTFLRSFGIEGEIFPTRSHSSDGIAVSLDSGECFIGDVEPLAYLNGYEENLALKQDWETILSYHPKIIYHAHANEKRL